MKRLFPFILAGCLIGGGIYLLNQYWIHRYDSLIARHAGAYHVDPDLVWSVIYEETYFRSWQIGGNGEVGLMQITPAVGREWASETGMHAIEKQMSDDPRGALRDPMTNIQVGCWYLEKLFRDYRDVQGREARVLASYNAGRSRVLDWNRSGNTTEPLTEDQFIARIDIPSTRAYVSSILARYRKLKAEKNPGRNLTRGDVQGQSR